MAKKNLLESMDNVLQEIYGSQSQDPEINDTSVQWLRQIVKKLEMLAHSTLEEIQEYERGQMDPKDFLETLHVDWITLVEQMDKMHKKLDDIGVDLKNTSLYTRGW
jgi:hypothetical protein